MTKMAMGEVALVSTIMTGKGLKKCQPRKPKHWLRRLMKRCAKVQYLLARLAQGVIVTLTSYYKPRRTGESYCVITSQQLVQVRTTRLGRNRTVDISVWICSCPVQSAKQWVNLLWQ